MSHFYLRLTLIPIALFTALSFIIRTQPYDDHQLRELLLPAGCSAPCFMGIRPGFTTDSQATQILLSNPWVQQVQYQPGSRIIWVTWNNLAPAWLVNQGKYSKTSILVNNSLVTEIHLNTSLTLADIQLTLGQSFHQRVYRANLRGHISLNYSAIYPQSGIYTNVSSPCDGQNKAITYDDKVYLGYTLLTYISDLPYKYDSTWADLLRTSCNRG